MFNKKLFYELCEKYGVELSNQYEKPMLKVDGEIREVMEQDVNDFLPQYQRIVPYQDSSIYTIQVVYTYEPQELMIA